MEWTYEAALAGLNSAVDLEKQARPAAMAPPSLDRMRALGHELGEPHRAVPVIHLTGTNGKTSTARICAALLGAAGLRVGVYTSPHLERVNERLVCDGRPIDDAEFGRVVGTVLEAAGRLADHPSFFELMTAAAFRWFAELAVDVAVVEVGLLGRWDATNIADGRVAVITSVGADHLDYAGSLEGVAREKAGIVKAGSRLVLGAVPAGFAEIFAQTPAQEILRLGEDFGVGADRPDPAGRHAGFRTPGASYQDVILALHGAHQSANAACALAAVEAFLGDPLPDATVRAGLGAVRVPGRLDIVRREPVAVLDGAHNPAAGAALAGALAEEFPATGWTVVYGALHGHDYAQTLAELRRLDVDRLIACEPGSPRAVPADQLAAAAVDLALPARTADGVDDAVRQALILAGPGGAVLVTGSFYHLAAARRALLTTDAALPRR